jgi:hypothetical protein
MKQFYKTCLYCQTSEWIPAIKLSKEDQKSMYYVCDKCKNKQKGKNKMSRYFAANQEKINSQPFTPQDDHWDSDLETVSDCSKAPEKLKVWITPLAKVKIDALMEKYPAIEWFAYLLGDPEGKDKFCVEDLHVPKQVITATSVDDIECEEFNDLPIIGAIHSHHGMGTGFSGTDHAFVNQNHDISLVISKSNIAGQVRWKTPCGCLKILDAVVKPKITVDFDKKAFLEMAVPNIQKKTYTPAKTANTGVGAGAGYITPGVGPGDWVNGAWVPKRTGKNAAQTSYTNGKSVKEIAKEAAAKKEEKGEPEEAADRADDTWESNEQSLMEALDEAFPEAETA